MSDNGLSILHPRMPMTTRAEAHYTNTGSVKTVPHMLIFSEFSHSHNSMSCDSEIFVYTNNIILLKHRCQDKVSKLGLLQWNQDTWYPYLRRQIINGSPIHFQITQTKFNMQYRHKITICRSSVSLSFKLLLMFWGRVTCLSLLKLHMYILCATASLLIRSLPSLFSSFHAS